MRFKLEIGLAEPMECSKQAAFISVVKRPGAARGSVPATERAGRVSWRLWAGRMVGPCEVRRPFNLMPSAAEMIGTAGPQIAHRHS